MNIRALFKLVASQIFMLYERYLMQRNIICGMNIMNRAYNSALKCETKEK